MRPTQGELENALIILEKLANRVPANFNNREAIGLEDKPGPILKEEIKAIRSLIVAFGEWQKEAEYFTTWVNDAEFRITYTTDGEKRVDSTNVLNFLCKIRDFGEEK